MVAPLIGAALVGGAASLLGGFSAQSHARDESKRQMDWQTEMSNTAHQREVKDLQKAGLNPMLTMGHPGASTPSGAMAPQHDAISPAVNSALQAATLHKVEAEIDLTSAQADKVRWETGNNSGDGSIHGLNFGGMQLEKLYQETHLIARQAALTNDQEHKLVQEVSNLKSEGDLLRLEARLKDLGIPEAEAIANFYKSEIGKASPYIKPLANAVGGVGSAFATGAAAKYLFDRPPLNIKRVVPATKTRIAPTLNFGGAGQKGRNVKRRK